MAWRFTIHSIFTGARMHFVEPSAGRWSRSPGAGDGQHEFMVRDSETALPKSVLRDITRPNQCVIAIAWDDGPPLYAGLIVWSHYKQSTGVATIKHVDIRALFRVRSTFPVGGYADGDIGLQNESLTGLARSIVNRGTRWPGWALPIDQPADSDGPYALPVKRWELARIDDLLVRIEDMGAIIDFDPYFTADGSLRWSTRVGLPELPGASYEWVSQDGVESPVTDLEVTLDGTQQVSEVIVPGKGSELDMKIGFASDPGGYDIPVRQGIVASKDESDVSRLNRTGQQYARRHRHHGTDWAFNLVADGSWSVSGMKPGARVRIWTVNDPFIFEDYRDLIVTGVSGDMTHVLKPEVERTW